MGSASVCSKATVLLLLIHWLFVLSLFRWVGVVIGPCYALLSSLSLSQSSGRGRTAGCFTLIVFLLSLLIVFGDLCLFLTVSWIGLQCVNFVTFPGHTYLFLRYLTHNCFFLFFFAFLFRLSIYRNHYSFKQVMFIFNCHLLVTRIPAWELVSAVMKSVYQSSK